MCLTSGAADAGDVRMQLVFPDFGIDWEIPLPRFRVLRVTTWRPPPRPRVLPGQLAIDVPFRKRHRNSRHRAIRAQVIPARALTRKAIGELAPEERAELEAARPRTRADCVEGLRPCPFVSCRHNLYLDVSEDTGSIKLNFPDLEPDEMEPSCALDVADAGGVTLERVGVLMNVTRERARQMYLDAKASATAAGLGSVREAMDNEEDGSGEQDVRKRWARRMWVMGEGMRLKKNPHGASARTGVHVHENEPAILALCSVCRNEQRIAVEGYNRLELETMASLLALMPSGCCGEAVTTKISGVA